MPNKKSPSPKPLYRRKLTAETQSRGEDLGKPVAESHFILKDDGTIQRPEAGSRRPEVGSRKSDDDSPSPGGEGRGEGELVPQLIFRSDTPFLRLYHGNCLELLDAIAAKYREGRFDAIFADPPYFLSNGGITCHAGRMVKVDKGDWDKSRGPELNHEFNQEWLRRCQRVLKPNGTIWVSGTHHVIFSIGYAMQQLGYKILNDIAWEKPNPPPNLSCRYFTHSTETILWAARDEKSKHVFNYQEMRKVTDKQMKTVWRDVKVASDEFRVASPESKLVTSHLSHATNASSADSSLNSIWTINAPTTVEKEHGKHPTQKPIALIERCLLASTNPGDLVLDPFLGGGTTAIAALKLGRGCVGIELDEVHLDLAVIRADKEIISIWLRHFRVTINVSLVGMPRCGVRSAQRADPTNFRQIDLDLFADSINGSPVDDKPQVPTERIFHECKFVFLACRVEALAKTGATDVTFVNVLLFT